MNDPLPAKTSVFPKNAVRLSPTDSIQELIGLRRALLVYARRRVSEPTLAQDLVQDTLEAALRGLHGFERRSSVSTWAFAILRNHIAEHYRRARTPVPMSVMLEIEDDDEEGRHDDARDRMIQWDLAGRGASSLVNTSTPEVHLARQQFWGSVATGMARLSPMQKEVFRLRDLMEQDAAQVSAALGISSNHCHVTLHRARARLRNFLEGHVDRLGIAKQAPR